MDSAKKRKLEAEPGPPMMSAFALRRRLLQQSSQPAEDEPVPDATPKASSHQRTTRQRTVKTLKETIAQEAVVQQRRAPPTVSRVSGNQDESSKSLLVRDTKSRSAETSAVAGRPEASDRLVQHSSFKPTKQNFRRNKDGSAVLKLSAGERLVILGSYGIDIRDGEVTVAGATLRPSDNTAWVHAPRCHALPVLRSADEATIVLSPHPDACSLRKLETLSPTFGRLWNEPLTDKNEAESFQIIYTSADYPARTTLQDLVSPAEWNKTIASLVARDQVKSAVVFVCGPKSSGKSTFSKLLANRFVTDMAGQRGRDWPRVAVLDIDPGQPEYSTPGTLSLVFLTEPDLEPSFCHPYPTYTNRKCVRSHAFASASPAMDPEHYVECVLDLYAAYQRELRNKCPLIINTPGWVQGTGLDILTELISRLHPAEVVYMSQDGPEETVQGLKSALQSAPLTQLPSQPSEYALRTALHLRTMQTLSFFHIDLASSSRGRLHWNAAPLTSVSPWILRFSGPEQGFLGVMCYDFQPPVDLLADAINGALVSIISIEDAAAFRTTSDSEGSDDEIIEETENVETDAGSETTREGETAGTESTRTSIIRTPEGLPLIQNSMGSSLDPRYSRAIGLALIRGIDVQKGELHLLAPFPLQDVNNALERGHDLVLACGKLDLPTWAYTEDLYSRSFASASPPSIEGESVEVTDEDTDDDTSELGEGDPEALPEHSEVPWVEMLHGDQRRAVGSRVWRVRRDLGKRGNTTD